MNDTTSTPALRKVYWCNVWNYASGLHGDGYGTKTHLTASTGRSGVTLCGRRFPAEKGYNSSGGYCKRCWKTAEKMGVTRESLRELDVVPNSTIDY